MGNLWLGRRIFSCTGDTMEGGSTTFRWSNLYIVGPPLDPLLLVMLAPTAKALNELLRRCQRFAEDHEVFFSERKSVCMMIPGQGASSSTAGPDIFCGENRLQYVSKYKYLGHFITEELKDEMNIDREVRSMYGRGNSIIRKLGFLPYEVKRSLFMSYCYPMYTSALWSNHIQ